MTDFDDGVDGVVGEDERDPQPGDPLSREERGRSYRADGITVYFNARKCWHTGICLRGLPEVFQLGRRPWIRADLDTPERVADLIHKCPSGALSYEMVAASEPAVDGGGLESNQP